MSNRYVLHYIKHAITSGGCIRMKTDKGKFRIKGMPHCMMCPMEAPYLLIDHRDGIVMACMCQRHFEHCKADHTSRGNEMPETIFHV